MYFGSVVVFLPQILILFLFILMLEATGYMTRAAFVMDRMMAAAGLSGLAFLYGLIVLPESLAPEKRMAFSWRRANPFGALQLLRSHPEKYPRLQKKHSPQAMENGTTTRSPTRSLVTSDPTSTTSPHIS